MGFFKKLKKVAKGAGHLLKKVPVGKIAGLATKTLIPGGATLGAIALSKLQSAGVNRSRLKLAAQNKLVTPVKASDLSLIGKTGNTDFRYTDSFKKLREGPKLTPAAKIRIKSPQLQVAKAVRKRAPSQAALLDLYGDWQYDNQGMTWETYAKTFGEK